MPSIGDVHRVAGVAGDDRLGQGVGEAGPQASPGAVRLDGGDAADGVLDGVVAGAAAEVALEGAGQVVSARFVGEARRGHDHAGGAEAALERLRVEERLLHRVQLAVAGEPLERGDLAALGPEGGDEAAVDRLAVEPDGAGAAVARRRSLS